MNEWTPPTLIGFRESDSDSRDSGVPVEDIFAQTLQFCLHLRMSQTQVRLDIYRHSQMMLQSVEKSSLHEVEWLRADSAHGAENHQSL